MSQNLSRRQLLRAGLAGSATLAAAAVHAAPAGLYKPGTYTAKAAGIASDVRVSMTFETDRIVDVVIDASSETPSIGQAAAEKLKKALLASQGAEIDAVSGATVTSNAVTRAARKCIEQAQGKIPVEVITEKTAEEASKTGDWLGKPPVIDEKDIVKTVKTEILVVGCGTSGMFAVASAAESGAKVIGINARNLKNLKVDVNKYNELAADLPDDVIKVAESGVFGAVEVEDYARAGADAVLVGEGVATADDHELAVERLVKAGAQVKASETTPLSEHQGPYWGQFGGRYVPEALITALDELERVYTQAKADPEFHKEFMTLQQRYVGRPSPLTEAPRFSALVKEKTGLDARIFLKREDLNHTGAHKINNALGQALLVKRMGKTRVIAETGAGQHGVATATVCAMLGLKCRIYMGQIDARRQALNVARMRMLGAEVVEVTLGDKILKDAINEALRDWVTNVKDTHYLLGTVAGPHPFPAMVRDFQKIIGEEAKQQLQDWYGIDHPDAVCACVGGGSNAIGVMNAFLDDERVNLYGYEAGGNGPVSGHHAIRFAPGTGQLGMFQGAKSYLLETDEGQTLDTYSISAGLDYASVGPEHAWLKEIGRVNYSWATDEEAMNAFRDLSQTEGIIPAIESSHAVAGAFKAAADLKAKGYDKAVMIVNISGRGDKDMATAGKWFGYLTDEQAAALDVTGAQGDTVA